MDQFERDLGVAIPKLGTLEVEGIPVEGGDAVVQLTAQLPHGGEAKMHLSLDAAKETAEAMLQIVATLEEFTS